MAKKTITVCLVALLAAFVLFNAYSWSNYLFLGLSVLIFAMAVVKNGGRFGIKCDAYLILNVLFILFVFYSSLWAKQASDSVIMSRTLLRTFFCAYLVYLALNNTNLLSETDLLQVVMWSGYVVAIYSLVYYGYDTLLLAGTSTSLRLGGEYANVNTIGMACALSCVIHINLVVMKKQRLFSASLIVLALALVVLAATQSRKAIVFLAVGALGALVIGAEKNGNNGLKKFAKILFGVVIFLFAVYAILQMEAFEGISQRIEYYVNSLTGTGKVDKSTTTRAALRAAGMKAFLKSPFAGVGMANAHLVAAETLGLDVYLHSNFVELLCGGGLIGFCIYYAKYAYLFKQLWNYRNVDRQRVLFFALWLGLMLIMDYGIVSYYLKNQNFYLMIHFINVLDLKRKAATLCESENISMR